MYLNSSASQSSNGVVLIGVGIASGSRKCLSRGVPFDLISFVLDAEVFRVRAGITSGIILIADNPAMYVGIASAQAVSAVASQAEAAVGLVLNRFGLGAWKIVHGGSFASDPEYLDLVAEYDELARQHLGPGATNETVHYFAGQTADVEFMRRRASVVVKFGWTGRNARGERDFDECYTQLVQGAKPGLTRTLPCVEAPLLQLAT